MSEKNNLSPIEKIKVASKGLRGTLKESLLDEHTGAIREPDEALVKFHGMYQQDDRDRREERETKKLERLYSFMIRLRLPGGFLTPERWRAVHHVAGEHSTGVIKITTRQTIQLHGILKSHVKPTIKAFNDVSLDSIAACGDVNRVVTCNALPSQSHLHPQIHAYADKISQLLLPKTKAYYEIWMDDELIAERSDETDPLYQDRYLPRKFKIGIAIPPNNDADVLINDIGLIAIIENDELKGFNIAVGGGLSFTHGNEATYPRLATVIGFTDTEEKTLKAIYEIVTIQRDFGNRSDRKQARLKYTFDKMGVEAFKKELDKRTGFKLEEPKPFTFLQRKDEYGWTKSDDGLWHYTAFVEGGRVTDDANAATKTGFYEIAKTGKANFRFTCNQNVIIADVIEEDKAEIDALLTQFGIRQFTENASAVRLNTVACVAFNTCGLALAEAQRYLPTLITKIEPILNKYELNDEDVIIRMTGCPNGCGRSTAAEIGFIGTAYGLYNLHIGGDRLGLRLNKKYKENLDEANILATVDELFKVFAKERNSGETFGDFSYRKWIANQ
ncbi:MAG: NADPH-dependent assimilatory sulfite reductase hemoprotein subunit [Sphingobacteriales bacterium]|nr:MAG: NADPH-dependent assimilatory sulfite reductase hemoprotein subunit [Sphingobacteriales bacterium]